ncbi:MAG: A/G-specific adenine glycosylase [Pseudomonadota bacterium]
MTPKKPLRFAAAVTQWQCHHGRRDLPWQIDPSPYQVWVSEVMLQQTQVMTVIPYFQRFMMAFPDIPSLAETSLEALLGLWAGLGYYARARHLHQTARILVSQRGGQLPANLEQLAALPGIGRSTAGAILSLGMGQSAPILDGNVRRVLCRIFAIDGWPGQGLVQRRLWRLATRLTPALDARGYNQGMMDLGSLVCTRTAPQCSNCPLQTLCRAHARRAQNRYPVARPRAPRPVREAWFLLVRSQGQVLLRRRPPTGLWGGLWSLPECHAASSLEDLCRQLTGHDPQGLEFLPVRTHDFTHYRLRFTVVLTSVPALLKTPLDSDLAWHPWASPPAGMPAPLTQLWHDLFPSPLTPRFLSYPS